MKIIIKTIEQSKNICKKGEKKSGVQEMHLETEEMEEKG